MRGKGPTSVFCYGYAIVLALVFEKSILPPLNGLGTLVENHLTVHVRVCFRALSCVPLIYMSVCVVTTVLCCSFF